MKPRYLLDTNICIYIARHQPPAVRARFERLKPGQLAMSIVTYGELSYGASKSLHRAHVLALLSQFIRQVPVLPLDSAVGEAYGEIRASLEPQGRVIGSNDLWIAAHAVSLGVILVTNNEREFSRIPRLRVENWTK